MKAEKFEVTCYHKGEKLQANCMRTDRVKAPEIYVHLRFKGKSETAFTFYEVGKNNERLFWFPHEGERQEMAQGIAEALERQLFMERKLAFYESIVK